MGDIRALEKFQSLVARQITQAKLRLNLEYNEDENTEMYYLKSNNSLASYFLSWNNICQAVRLTSSQEACTMSALSMNILRQLVFSALKNNTNILEMQKKHQPGEVNVRHTHAGEELLEHFPKITWTGSSIQINDRTRCFPIWVNYNNNVYVVIDTNTSAKCLNLIVGCDETDLVQKASLCVLIKNNEAIIVSKNPYKKMKLYNKPLGFVSKVLRREKEKKSKKTNESVSLEYTYPESYISLGNVNEYLFWKSASFEEVSYIMEPNEVYKHLKYTTFSENTELLSYLTKNADWFHFGFCCWVTNTSSSQYLYEVETHTPDSSHYKPSTHGCRLELHPFRTRGMKDSVKASQDLPRIAVKESPLQVLAQIPVIISEDSVETSAFRQIHRSCRFVDITYENEQLQSLPIENLEYDYDHFQHILYPFLDTQSTFMEELVFADRHQDDKMPSECQENKLLATTDAQNKKDIQLDFPFISALKDFTLNVPSIPSILFPPKISQNFSSYAQHHKMFQSRTQNLKPDKVWLNQNSYNTVHSSDNGKENVKLYNGQFYTYGLSPFHCSLDEGSKLSSVMPHKILIHKYNDKYEKDHKLTEKSDNNFVKIITCLMPSDCSFSAAEIITEFKRDKCESQCDLDVIVYNNALAKEKVLHDPHRKETIINNTEPPLKYTQHINIETTELNNIRINGSSFQNTNLHMLSKNKSESSKCITKLCKSSFTYPQSSMHIEDDNWLSQPLSLHTCRRSFSDSCLYLCVKEVVFLDVDLLQNVDDKDEYAESGFSKSVDMHPYLSWATVSHCQNNICMEEMQGMKQNSQMDSQKPDLLGWHILNSSPKRKNMYCHYFGVEFDQPTDNSTDIALCKEQHKLETAFCCFLTQNNNSLPSPQTKSKHKSDIHASNNIGQYSFIEYSYKKKDISTPTVSNYTLQQDLLTDGGNMRCKFGNMGRQFQNKFQVNTETTQMCSNNSSFEHPQTCKCLDFDCLRRRGEALHDHVMKNLHLLRSFISEPYKEASLSIKNKESSLSSKDKHLSCLTTNPHQFLSTKSSEHLIMSSNSSTPIIIHKSESSQKSANQCKIHHNTCNRNRSREKCYISCVSPITSAQASIVYLHGKPFSSKVTDLSFKNMSSGTLETSFTSIDRTHSSATGKYPANNPYHKAEKDIFCSMTDCSILTHTKQYDIEKNEKYILDKNIQNSLTVEKHKNPNTLPETNVGVNEISFQNKQIKCPSIHCKDILKVPVVPRTPRDLYQRVVACMNPDNLIYHSGSLTTKSYGLGSAKKESDNYYQTNSPVSNSKTTAFSIDLHPKGGIPLKFGSLDKHYRTIPQEKKNWCFNSNSELSFKAKSSCSHIPYLSKGTYKQNFKQYLDKKTREKIKTMLTENNDEDEENPHDSIHYATCCFNRFSMDNSLKKHDSTENQFLVNDSSVKINLSNTSLVSCPHHAEDIHVFRPVSPPGKNSHVKSPVMIMPSLHPTLNIQTVAKIQTTPNIVLQKQKETQTYFIHEKKAAFKNETSPTLEYDRKKNTLPKHILETPYSASFEKEIKSGQISNHGSELESSIMKTSLQCDNSLSAYTDPNGIKCSTSSWSTKSHIYHLPIILDIPLLKQGKKTMSEETAASSYTRQMYTPSICLSKNRTIGNNNLKHSDHEAEKFIAQTTKSYTLPYYTRSKMSLTPLSLTSLKQEKSDSIFGSHSSLKTGCRCSLYHTNMHSLNVNTTGKTSQSNSLLNIDGVHSIYCSALPTEMDQKNQTKPTNLICEKTSQISAANLSSSKENKVSPVIFSPQISNSKSILMQNQDTYSNSINLQTLEPVRLLQNIKQTCSSSLSGSVYLQNWNSELKSRKTNTDSQIGSSSLKFKELDVYHNDTLKPENVNPHFIKNSSFQKTNSKDLTTRLSSPPKLSIQRTSPISSIISPNKICPQIGMTKHISCRSNSPLLTDKSTDSKSLPRVTSNLISNLSSSSLKTCWTSHISRSSSTNSENSCSPVHLSSLPLKRNESPISQTSSSASSTYGFTNPSPTLKISRDSSSPPVISTKMISYSSVPAVHCQLSDSSSQTIKTDKVSSPFSISIVRSYPTTKGNPLSCKNLHFPQTTTPYCSSRLLDRIDQSSVANSSSLRMGTNPGTGSSSNFSQHSPVNLNICKDKESKQSFHSTSSHLKHTQERKAKETKMPILTTQTHFLSTNKHTPLIRWMLNGLSHITTFYCKWNKLLLRFGLLSALLSSAAMCNHCCVLHWSWKASVDIERIIEDALAHLSLQHTEVPVM